MIEYVVQNGLTFGVLGTIAVVLLGLAGVVVWNERHHR